MTSHSSSNTSLNMEDIVKELNEIEAKYTPKANKKCSKIPLYLHENLAVLSKEFDSLGLTVIDPEQSLQEILEQVVNSSRDLIQIHRNALNNIRHKNIETISRDNRHKELYEKMDNYKENLEKLKTSCMLLKNSKLILSNEIKELKQRELTYKEELNHIKRFYSSKEQLLEHNVQKLNLEVERLKEICGQDIVSETTKNEIALKLIKKHKLNEEIYKMTIKSMQENNQALLDEILSLKEEIIILRAK